MTPSLKQMVNFVYTFGDRETGEAALGGPGLSARRTD